MLFFVYNIQLLTYRYLKNITWSHIISVNEQITYTSPSPTTTTFSQTARVDAFGTLGVILEDLCFRSFQRNSSRGRMAMEGVLEGFGFDRVGRVEVD